MHGKGTGERRQLPSRFADSSLTSNDGLGGFTYDPVAMMPDVKVMKMGGQSIMDRGREALFPILDELVALKDEEKLLICCGGGTRARHVYAIASDLELPTGVLAALGGFVPRQNARMLQMLLARHGDASIATACHAIHDPAEAFNPNVVKVVRDVHGYALYFSRATIPWARDAFAADRGVLPPGLPVYRHYGLYAYRVAFLARYPALAPAPIERFEALEQLRALWHGERIVVEVTQATPAPGIDTPEDLVRVRAMLERMPHRD